MTEDILARRNASNAYALTIADCERQYEKGHPMPFSGDALPHGVRIPLRLQKLLDGCGGRLPVYAWPGGYCVIYWFADDHGTFPVCGDCVGEFLAGEFGPVTFADYETGDCYDESVECDHCKRQLAAYYEE